MAYNLSRAAGVTAGGKLAGARTATIRASLINIPARLSRSARSYTLHLPVNSPRQTGFMAMFDAAEAPPQAPDPSNRPPTQAPTSTTRTHRHQAGRYHQPASHQRHNQDQQPCPAVDPGSAAKSWGRTQACQTIGT